MLERLTLASTFLPPGVVPYLAPDATALGQIFWYTVEGEGYDLGRLRAIQDWYVRYQLNSVPGVAQVASVGGYPIEYQIDVDPNKLRSLRRHAGRVVRRRGPLQLVGRRPGDPKGQRRISRSAASAGSARSATSKTSSSSPTRPRARRSASRTWPRWAGAREFRRSVLEKNGNEAVGAVVMMRYGENPLAVTQAHQGEDRAASAGPARGRAHRPLLRPHAADRRGHPHADRDPHATK